MHKRGASKYRPLTAYLQAQRGDRVPMSFADIERVIGAKLPPSADSHRAWWSNNPTNNVMTSAWLDAGFESERVDLSARQLTFRRARDAAANTARGNAMAPLDFVTASTNFQEAGAAALYDPGAVKPPLFGWLGGTVSVSGDLTEPADPDWEERGDDEHSPLA
jgi:hypothetical protein